MGVPGLSGRDNPTRLGDLGSRATGKAAFDKVQAALADTRERPQASSLQALGRQTVWAEEAGVEVC